MADTKIDSSLPFYEVRCFLAEATPGDVADQRVADLLRLPVGPGYTTDLNAATEAMKSLGWWWSLSHLQATVTPTSRIDGIPANNSAFYDKEGKPISYRSVPRLAGPLVRL